MMKNSEIYESGFALLQKLHGGHAGEAIIEGLKDICRISIYNKCIF
jgi:hypothetical protein